FEDIPQSINAKDLRGIKDILYKVGQRIKSEGTPTSIPPVIIGICGSGKTSAGAQEMLDFLPVENITLDQLQDTFEKGSRNKIYQLVMDIPEMYRLREGVSLQQQDDASLMKLYFQQPELFESNIDQVFPYVTCLLNCILWSPKYPRLITREQAKEWYETHQTLEVIGDITCDPEGAIQFSQETWIDDPVFIYNPIAKQNHSGFRGEGVAVMAVTNLPCEFSKDASTRFSSELKPYLPAIFLADYEAYDMEEAGLPAEIQAATILWKGQFTPTYAYMNDYIAE
ncbi:MAG: hypothetical protein AAF789_14970, partial [Bacteroidota bacterium]